MVALPQTSVAPSPPAGQCRDRPSTGRLLCRGTQPRASSCGLSRADARRNVLRHRPHVPADLKSGAVAARRARREANRSASCDRMPLGRCGRMSTDNHRATAPAICGPSASRRELQVKSELPRSHHEDTGSVAPEIGVGTHQPRCRLMTRTRATNCRMSLQTARVGVVRGRRCPGDRGRGGDRTALGLWGLSHSLNPTTRMST